MFSVLTAAVAVVVVLLGFVVYRIYQNRYHPKDFKGAGAGSVAVVVNSGDGAKDIGKTLHNKGVVASVRAFTERGVGQLEVTRHFAGHLQAAQAHVGEECGGAAAQPSRPAQRPGRGVRGRDRLRRRDRHSAKALGVSQADVKAAIANVKALGLPRGYASGTKAPSSVEGFLYPATYSFDPGTKPSDALQEMITSVHRRGPHDQLHRGREGAEAHARTRR